MAPTTPTRQPSIGRADLFRLFCLSDDSARRAAFARLCGYEEKEEKKEKKSDADQRDRPGQQPPEPTPDTGREQAPAGLGFWRVVRVETGDEEAGVEVPEWFREAETISRESLLNARRPAEDRPFPLLSPWSRLGPFLRRELSRAVPGRMVDTGALVRQIARCRPIRQAPRRPVRRWAGAIHVLCDTSEPLRTFFNDMNELVGRLKTICGRHRIKMFAFPRGPAARGFEFESDRLEYYRFPEQPTMLLALSDLGALTEDHVTRQWAVDLGRVLERLGSRPVALLPCPPSRWGPGFGRRWRPVWWDIGRRLRVRPFRTTYDHRTTDEPDAKGLVPEPEGLERFLRLMSPVVRPDPELIRYIRALLPADRTDAGMESDICAGRHDYRRKLEEFPLEAPSDRCHRLVDLLNWFHGAFPDILAEEMTHIRSVYPDLPKQIKDRTDDFNADLAFSLDEQRWLAEGFTRDEFIGYIKRWEGRLPPSAFKDKRVAAAWVLAHLKDDGLPDTDRIPRELPMEEVAWALKSGRRRRYRLVQVQQSLVAVKEGSAEAGEYSSPLGRIASRTDLVFIKSLGGAEPTKRSWLLDQPSQVVLSSALPSQGFRIETSDNLVELEQIPKPAWAREMGRDRDGLFVRLADDRRFYWLNPGRYELRERKGDSPIDIEKGCWLQEEKYHNHLAAGILTPDWEEHLAEDRAGLYETISIKGMRQVFRWIPPGRFLMGSPEEEPERDDDELQHEVELTKGFWLAETACTQALWEAVMGENPSEFKGADRPVDSVSWEDCQAFIERINNDSPDLNLRLPTEAQWEYACRAGTTTPFSFGKTIGTEQVNYNGKYPYAGGVKGEFRGETVDVKTLRPNDWGLYEMHGNLFEWCSDWYGSYENGLSIDPQGPAEGEDRVLRGGAWGDDAGYCRSAFRFRLRPGNRGLDVGFRVSRGQEGRAQEKDRKQDREAAPREAQRSGDGLAQPGNFFGKTTRRIKKIVK